MNETHLKILSTLAHPAGGLNPRPGHHRGTLAGIPPTGRWFEYVGAAFFASRDGRLASAIVLGDLDGLRRQLQAD
jgi:predicted ester cyclase